MTFQTKYIVPNTIEITTTNYTENEYGGSNCDQLFSFTNEYVLNNNTFTLIQNNIDNIDYTILTLNENELEWETISPDANQVIKFTYERVN